MKRTWFLMSVGLSTALFAPQAQAAVVAVMPVQGVNLARGQCDAIGVLFANAFARETNVVVASPLETGPLLAQGKTAQAVTAELGAAEFVDLHAVQLENRVTLAGIRYGKDGNEIFRSETSARSLDDMELAAAKLARSLAWRRPTALAPAPTSFTARDGMTGPAPYPKALGIKTALIVARSGSRSYAPMMSLQFDGRVGSRNSFVELGAGAAIPASSSTQEGDVQMGGIFAELGGSLYLSDGEMAPYLGAGVSPRIWFVDDPYADAHSGGTCTIYGQFGVTFTRDSRARLYAELRVSQYVLGISESSNGSTANPSSDSLYPTEFALQLGIGW
jgi:hypothetical protein